MTIVLGIIAVWFVLWAINGLTIWRTGDDGCAVTLVLILGVLVALIGLSSW